MMLQDNSLSDHKENSSGRANIAEKDGSIICIPQFKSN